MNNKFGIIVKCILKDEDYSLRLLKQTEQEGINDINISLYDIAGGRLKYGENIEDNLVKEALAETEIKLQTKDIKILNATSIIRKDGLHLVIIAYATNTKYNEVDINEEYTNFYKTNKNFKTLPKWIEDIISIVC